ncbi:uncharacterized protein LOC142233879 [Haematobia irritans]|uniref:uncharacterized protein LOC142233879 n=1 Tax=Haematobia irritans TaxID=7368 RepID=UPI003F4F7DAB
MFFVLMDGKTKKIYDSLFHYIKENIYNMEPSVVITDYEEALRQSIKQVYPGIKMVGCWFHYCQAIKRNMRSHKQLLQYIKSSKPASAEYHKIMALPLLPPNLIGTSFRDIKGKIFLMDSEGVFLPFLNYYERQWIQKIGSKNFSVYNQKTRTTSAVEAYNGVLGRSADRGGDFFKFVAVIRNEEFFKSRQFEQCVEGGGTLCKRKKKNRTRCVTD